MAKEKRLIDANALTDKVDESKHNNPHPQGMVRVNHRNEHDHFLRMIMDAPTVDAVEVVHGEWVMCLDIDDVEFIECPLCGGQFYDGDNDTFDKPYNYCPNCGAKMDGDGNA